MSWATIVKCLPYLIAAVIAGAAVWGVQEIRIGHLENTVTSRDNDIRKWDAAYKLCTDANTTDAATIVALQADVKKAIDRCGSQLAAKERTTNRLYQIDMLKPNNPSLLKEKHENKTGIFVDDPILAALNGMFTLPGQAPGADSQTAVRQAAGAAPSGKAPGLPGALPDSGPARVLRWYCLDEIGAKNLLKDFELKSGRERELEAIVEGMR
jgi:hypothetical protein